MNRTLVIFDIDGTLVDTDGLHYELIKEILACDGLDIGFKPAAAYAHYTDYCVLDELYRHNHGRGVGAGDILRYDTLYAEALGRSLSAEPMREIPGAGAVLDELTARDDVAIAFATGSLRSMARMKLDVVGIDTDQAALATGSEHLTREAIVQDAIVQAEYRFGQMNRVLILGDGPWDQRTARNLSIPFIAIESGTHRFGAGPVAVWRDYTDFDAETLLAYAAPIDGFRRMASALSISPGHI